MFGPGWLQSRCRPQPSTPGICKLCASRPATVKTKALSATDYYVVCDECADGMPVELLPEQREGEAS